MPSSYENFDIKDPHLPDAISDKMMSSGGYPYEDKLKREKYEDRLLALQCELVKLQSHLQSSGERVAIVFEGRDAAGKGGSIKNFLAYLNPRHNRVIALSKPNDQERTQWYFQRYAVHMPSAGEMVLFDRSWYNRAGVEPVMGFCSPEDTKKFLYDAPRFEEMLSDDGIHLFKFWLNIGQEMQLKRFHDRRHSPLKAWKLSPIDLKALTLWDDYSDARTKMLEETDTKYAPWTVVRSNDKRRARIGVIQTVLDSLKYAGKDKKIIGDIDDQIVMNADDFIKQLTDDE